MLRRPLLTFLLASACAWGQSASEPGSAPTQPAQPPSAAADESHQPRIHGLEIGMTVQQVLDVLARMPDKRDDKDGDVIVDWKLEDGSVLQVNFHKEHVSHLRLQYRPPRPTNDFWLVPLEESSHYQVTDPNRKRAVEAEGTSTLGDPQNISSAETRDTAPRISSAEHGGPLETPDKRLRREYKVSETYDKERTVWKRGLKAPAGYGIELSFLSTARQEFGARYETKVEYKYVSVAKEDLKKFEQAYAGR